MKRILATSSLALVVLIGSACKRPAKVEPIKLIPEGATVIGGVDVKSVVSSKTYQDNQSIIEQGEGKEGLEAARACQIGPETWKHVLFGLNGTAPDTQTAVIVEATGLGKKETLDCLAGQFKAKEGKDPWTMEEKDGRLTLKLTDSDFTALVVDDDTVAVTGSGWLVPMQGLLAGQEGATSAVDGSLKPLIDRTEKDQIWIAGTIPAGMAQPPVEGAQDANVAINVSDGLAVKAAVGFGSPADAQAKAKALSEQYAQLKTVIAGAGIPQAVLDGVTIEPKDSTVQVGLRASAQDVETLSKQAAGLVGGLQ